MASVRDTVIFGLVRYPTLFKTPGDVFHHLFFVAGNGFHWVKGELVGDDQLDGFNVDDTAAKQVTKMQERIDTLNSDPRFVGMDLTLDDERALMNYRFTIRHLDRVVDGRNLRRAGKDIQNPYSLCREYAKICTMPDDVTTDWLTAAYHVVLEMLPNLREREQQCNLSREEKVYLEELPILLDKFRLMLSFRHDEMK